MRDTTQSECRQAEEAECAADAARNREAKQIYRAAARLWREAAEEIERLRRLSPSMENTD